MRTNQQTHRLKVNPRPKDVNGVVYQPPPVELTVQRLEELFSLPLNEAAKHLGVCETSLKSACRKIGITKWPYRKVKNCTEICTHSLSLSIRPP